MAKDQTPIVKRSRRLGVVLGKEKYARRRNYPPGIHGPKQARSRSRLSSYGEQLREKQKAKIYYGMSESQFRQYFETASKKVGDTGVMMQQHLEMRLDNVVFRLGLVHSRQTARELVSHGHFSVNGNKVNIPSYQVRVGDAVAVREVKKKSTYFVALPKLMERYQTPQWLSCDVKNLEGKVLSIPSPEDAAPVYDMKSIVEFYSR